MKFPSDWKNRTCSKPPTSQIWIGSSQIPWKCHENAIKMPWNDHQEMPDHQTISQKYLPLNFTQKITRKSHEMRNIRIKCTCFIIFPSSIPSNPSNPSLPRHILPSSIDTWRRKSTQKKKKLAPVGMWHKRKQYGLVLKREGYLNFIHTYVNVYVYILHG